MKNKKLMPVIVILIILTVALGLFNKRRIEANNKNSTITFLSGKQSIELKYEEITSLEYDEFNAIEDTSSSGPTSRKYKGVLLKAVLNKALISDDEILDSSKILVKGIDGYVVALPPEDIIENKAYLVFEKDGKELGNIKDGGSGPFQLVVRSDTFSQRWCKYVFEVSVE